ncbi:DUF2398 family protein [Kitasatospora sp. NBC_00240]|uniref:TIGR02678 family protein n=1 Tax=Kitasatospora sp. NBC_00240 TaxID=2903567 RepID=UPI002258BD3C|nr:DUF2398 family protein [Kitasatospora sp. NBC_00240]MCX5209501.1 DUF2398 family protein [Kitasatospora sp. NBC_00240]
MDQQEHAVGTVRVPGGTSDGRTGGAGRGTTDACVAVRDNRPDEAPGGLPGGRPAAGRTAGYAGLDGTPDPGLLRLAGWFAEASDEGAHDLFTAAFGLYGARHFGARHGAAAAGAPAPAPDAPGPAEAVSWWHGPSALAEAARPVREARPLPGPRRSRRTAGAAVDAAAPAAGGRRGKHRRPEPAPAPAGPQERSAAAERRIAARLLLAHPLITAAGPHGEGFPLIRRHRDWLTERFDALLGYRLVVGPWHARLGKAGLGPGGARRLEHPGSGTPFTPGEYAQLAVALSVLVDAPERLPLGRLVAAVRAASPPPAAGRGPGPEADLAGALRVLTDWQVLSATGSGLDTLDPTTELTVDRELARALPAGPPAPAADAEDLVRRAAETDPGTAVRRRLAETPVVLHDDLAGAERAWLAEQWHTVAGTFAEFLGLEAELRTEGVALLDPADELTDLALPGTGTLARAALLLVERLVEELRPLPGEPTAPAVPIPDALIDGALGDIADEYGLRAGWRRDYLADRTALRRDALDLLARMGLIAPTPRGTYPPGWLLRAPAARYAPQAELLPTPGTGRHSRRDGADGADDGEPAGYGELGPYGDPAEYENAGLYPVQEPGPCRPSEGVEPAVGAVLTSAVRSGGASAQVSGGAPGRAERPARGGQVEAVVPPARGPAERPQQLPA